MGWSCDACGGSLYDAETHQCAYCEQSAELAKLREAVLSVFDADIKIEWKILTIRAAERFKHLQGLVEGCYPTTIQQ